MKIAVVDNHQGIGGPLPLDSSHYNLQGSIAGDMVAPGADVGGTTLYKGNLEALINRGQSLYDRAMARVDEAKNIAGPDGVISWVAPLGGLSNSQVIDVVNKLGTHGGPVVMGTGVFSATQLKDPAVQTALRNANIILVDTPLRGNNPPSTLTPSGQSAPAGAGNAVTTSLPTNNGWGSVAVPSVAGTVALMLQANPSLTGADVRKILSDPANFSQTATTADGTVVPLFDAKEAVQAALNYTP